MGMPPTNRGIIGMSDFTINDTMAEICYELDDREIYNDIRSEIGTLISETVVDADPTYNWQIFTRYATVLPGETIKLIYQADHATASNWQLYAHAAVYRASVGDWQPYYDYAIDLEEITALTKYAVNIENTGSYEASFVIGVKYKYLAAEQITHEQLVPLLLSIQTTDATSIKEYGRRVMNLTWSEGTSREAMQAIIDYFLARHKDPVARLRATIKGKTNALMTQFTTREISDLVTVVCTNLGINADYFINSISISDDSTGVPVCTWGLEAQRSYEALALFVLDTSELDGAHILGS